MKCVTKEGLEHNFQWSVDENINNSLASLYTILPKNHDNNSNEIVLYNLRGSIK